MSVTIKLDRYVLDTLLRDLVGHDRHPSAFLVYLHLWAKSEGGGISSGPWSLRRISEATGLSKRAVQMAIERLEKRELIEIERQGPDPAPSYRVSTPWRRSADG